MNNGEPLQQKNRIYDYIFMCFFLGNDFMPHFPAFNIRTHGIQILTDTYRTVIGKYPERSFVNITTGKIQWKWVHLFIDNLAKQEHEHFLAEMNARDKNNKRQWTSNTPEEQEQILHHLPIIYRGDEKYICPYEKGWEKRYYKLLFHISPNDENIKTICINYLEGLEWTMKYYTTGCPDWRWCYNYNYPPLLRDLIRYIPYFDTEFVVPREPSPVTPLVQLCYVLPRQSLQFLPPKLYNALRMQHSNWYPADCEFVWAYCRYFWEAHVELPHLDIDELHSFVNANMA
jgi:5'-3' exonuclease